MARLTKALISKRYTLLMTKARQETEMGMHHMREAQRLKREASALVRIKKKRSPVSSQHIG